MESRVEDSRLLLCNLPSKIETEVGKMQWSCPSKQNTNK